MDEVVEALEKYQGLVPLVYDIETMSLDEARSEDMQYAVYLKREADKVINHQKYKRCLAMAKECEATALWCYQAANTLPIGFHAKLFGKPVMIEPDRLYNRFERLIKWSNRWLKIAEQLKE